MNTPVTGEIRSKTTLPLNDASLLLSLLKQRRTELDDLAGLVADLHYDFPKIRELRHLLSHLKAVQARLERARPYAVGLWNEASVAADKEAQL